MILDLQVLPVSARSAIEAKMAVGGGHMAGKIVYLLLQQRCEITPIKVAFS